MTIEELETSALVHDSSVHFAVSRLEVISQQTKVWTRVVALVVLNNKEATMDDDITPIDYRNRLQNGLELSIQT